MSGRSVSGNGRGSKHVRADCVLLNFQFGRCGVFMQFKVPCGLMGLSGLVGYKQDR